MNTYDAIVTQQGTQFTSLNYQQDVPVIQKGAIKNCKYYRDWSFDHLNSKIGPRPVMVAHAENGYYDFTNREAYKMLEISLSEALGLITAKETGRYYYLMQLPVALVLPELLEELDLPPGLTHRDVISALNLWIGGEGCVTPLHYDLSPNFLVQVRGTKKLRLFSPEHSPYLYPKSEPGLGFLSQIDLRNVDQARFPLLEKAKVFECVLEAGDVLYIPQGWWHEVETVEASISLNYWFLKLQPYQGAAAVGLENLSRQFQYVIGLGVGIHFKDYQGELVLFKAIKEGMTEVVEAMLINGADPDATSCVYRQGATAIAFAAELGNQEIVDLLLRYKARTVEG